MKLAPKLTALFLLLSILPTAVVGYLAYENGRRMIVQETIDHLVSINLLKSNELKRWIKGNENSIEQLAERPWVRQYAAALTRHDTAHSAYQLAKGSMIEGHLKPRLKYGGFFELFLMCPRRGLIPVSTDKNQEGKYRDTFPYFKEGKKHTYVQGVYYSPALEQPAMTISTPIKDEQGNLLGVLAGRLNLGELSKIISLQTGESATEDTYLVNTFNFFVTEPRFGQGYALKKAVRTEGVEAGLSGRDGTGFYKDYRGVSVIGAYKWLPEFNMCIITEIDKAEAFAPIVRLAWVTAGIASAISIGVGLLGLFFARTITRPLQQLAAGAEKIGKGNLEHRVGTGSKDEIGGLSSAFDLMADALAEKEAQVREYTGALEHKIRERTRELRESEEKYRGLFESLTDGINMTDLEGHIVECNRSYREMLGYTKEEIRKLTYQQLTPSKWHEMEAAIVRDQIIERGYSERYEKEYIRKDGTVFPIDIKVWQLKDDSGRPAKMWGIVRDITERKKAEEALKMACARLERMFSSNVVGVVIADPQGGFLEVNDYYLNVLGFTRSEFEAGQIRWDERTPPEHLPADRRAIEELRERGVCTPYEKEYIRKDGSRVWVLIADALIPGSDEQMLALVVDVTERKRAEEETRKLNVELEQRVRRRTAELEAANKELEAFSYSVSHDLRAPLRAIDGFSGAVWEDYFDKLDNEGKRYLNIIRNNTQKMGQLIDDLLVFSQLGRQEIKASDIDMGRLASAVSKELGLSTPDRKIELNIKTLPSSQGDSSMIRQVFANLLSNAIKFTRPRETAEIEVGGSGGEKENVYCVRDNGVGFDTQYAHKLFGVFQRLHSSEEFEGTGVGLAIVQRIIHRHGGKVWAEGKVGEGAVFCFTLPRGTKDDR
jgi:PAS domain S-box-containing protein